MRLLASVTFVVALEIAACFIACLNMVPINPSQSNGIQLDIGSQQESIIRVLSCNASGGTLMLLDYIIGLLMTTEKEGLLQFGMPR